MIVTACLFAYPPQRWAGADIFNAHLLEALAAAGHDVRVFTTRKTPASVRNGVKVHGSARDYPRDTKVIYTAPDAGTTGPMLANRLRAHLVGVIHNTASPTTAAVKRRGWDLLVWNSNTTRDHHKGEGGLIVRPPVYMPDEHWYEDNRYFASEAAVTIINLSEDKGAKVWWELAARNPDTPFLGIMSWGTQITAHPEGTYCPNVTILPSVPHDHMCDVWARTGVLLCPSKTEAWGMAAVEALAHEIPVIAHPTPGLRESLGYAGLFVDRGDLDQWDLLLDALHPSWPWDPERSRARAREVQALSEADTAAFVDAVEGL